MPGIYASAALICLASLLAGRAVLAALGRREWTWLEGAVGLALLIAVAAVAVRLPGRGAGAAVALGLVLAGSLAYMVRARGFAIDRRLLAAGLPVALVVLAATAIPFVLTGRAGVLGEGVYSNDHAVHLYWAEWLREGVGPEPRGIGWGYPVGPHSLVAGLAGATGADLETAFNGLLVAIPALTALTALAALKGLPAMRRTAAAALVGLPYLGAAFLAQSAFKETAVALYVLAFALALGLLPQPGRARPIAAALVLLPLAAVLTLSIPALAWFALGGAIWLVAGLATGRLAVSREEVSRRLRPAWPLLAAVAVALAALVVLQHDALSRFIERVDEVQETTGRLIERQPPWQVLGVWPEGDFRLRTGIVDGALVAIALGAAALAAGLAQRLRRREVTLPAMLAAAAAVYAYTLAFGGIHVQAKALAIAAPLVALVVLGTLLRPGAGWRLRLGALFLLAAAASTALALRLAPVGSTERAAELESLRERVRGGDVAFLSLDRFAPYRLRGAERVRSPGGYVPAPLHPRGAKRWEQGQPLDFDSVPGGLLGEFGYALTSSAAYASSAPGGFREAARTPSFILWERTGRVPRRRVLRREGGSPGHVLRCEPGDRLAGRAGTAGAIPRPVVRRFDAWSPTPEFVAPGEASVRLELPRGHWRLSLQYHSEVEVSVRAGDLRIALPPALEGMYAFAPGRGPFWPLGRVRSDGGPLAVRASSAEPSWLERLVRAQRRVWLGRIAATPVRGASAGGDAGGAPGPPAATEIPLSAACGRYLDWYQLRP